MLCSALLGSALASSRHFRVLSRSVRSVLGTALLLKLYWNRSFPCFKDHVHIGLVSILLLKLQSSPLASGSSLQGELVAGALAWESEAGG